MLALDHTHRHITEKVDSENYNGKGWVSSTTQQSPVNQVLNKLMWNEINASLHYWVYTNQDQPFQRSKKNLNLPCQPHHMEHRSTWINRECPSDHVCGAVCGRIFCVCRKPFEIQEEEEVSIWLSMPIKLLTNFLVVKSQINWDPTNPSWCSS